ncbi:MAG: hypothetical protein ACJ79H_07890 [Myxococcales bacterium]
MLGSLHRRAHARGTAASANGSRAGNYWSALDLRDAARGDEARHPDHYADEQRHLEWIIDSVCFVDSVDPWAKEIFPTPRREARIWAYN